MRFFTKNQTNKENGDIVDAVLVIGITASMMIGATVIVGGAVSSKADELTKLMENPTGNEYVETTPEPTEPNFYPTERTQK